MFETVPTPVIQKMWRMLTQESESTGGSA